MDIKFVTGIGDTTTIEDGWEIVCSNVRHDMMGQTRWTLTLRRVEPEQLEPLDQSGKKYKLPKALKDKKTKVGE